MINYFQYTTYQRINNEQILFINGSKGITVHYSDELESQEGEIFIYNKLDTNKGDFVKYGLPTLDSYKQFLHIKAKTKGISIKKIIEFSSYSISQRLQIINGELKVKGISGATLTKLKTEGIVLLEYPYEETFYNKISTILNKETNNKESVKNFLEEVKGLDKKSEQEIKNLFMDYIIG